MPSLYTVGALFCASPSCPSEFNHEPSNTFGRIESYNVPTLKREFVVSTATTRAT